MLRQIVETVTGVLGWLRATPIRIYSLAVETFAIMFAAYSHKRRREALDDDDGAKSAKRPCDSVDEAVRERWEKDQDERKRAMRLEDTAPWAYTRCVFDNDNPGVVKEDTLRYVAGVDISFIKGDDVNACAAVVVISLPDLEVVYSDLQMIKLTEPYIPGFLAYREVPSLAVMLDKLRESRPDVAPQAILVDGNGIIHPRGFGLACHLGQEAGLPCIGVAKHLFHVGGLENSPEHKHKIKTLLLKSGDSFPLTTDAGEVLGVALRSHDDAPNPIYVSPGNYVTLDTAVWVVKQCCRHRVPEPVRQADIQSREYLRVNFKPEGEQ